MAISYALRPDNENLVKAKVVIEAANAATTPEAEAALSARGVAVVPDFVANAGAAAWAWWLLLGEVGADPADSFLRLRTEMQSKVALLLAEWNMDRLPLRVTGLKLVEANRAARAEVALTPEGEPAAAHPVSRGPRGASTGAPRGHLSPRSGRSRRPGRPASRRPACCARRCRA